MTNIQSPRLRQMEISRLSLESPSQDSPFEAIGAFLVAGLYLAALPIELFLGTRVPFPFIAYTIAASGFVLFLRWRRLEDGLLALFGRGNRTKAVFHLLIAGLIFWFALQAFVSPCPNYAQRKYVLWLVNAMLPLLAGYLWIDRVERLDTLLRAGAIWVALVLAFWVASPNAMANLDARHVVLRGEFSELTSCSFCRSVCMAAMVCVVSVGLRVFKGPAALIPAGFVPALLYLALQSGSRGAVLSFIAAVSFFLLFSLNHRRLLLLAGCISLLVVAAFAHIAATNSMTGIIDSGLLQGDVRDGSVLEHFTAWQLSLSTAIREPFGVGFGGYPHIAGYGDEPLYPHNAVLEVWVESGLVGLGLYVCLIVLPFVHLGRRSLADKRMAAMTSLFVITFLFAMTYLGIEGSNPYWFFLGALWAAAASTQTCPVRTTLKRDRATAELRRILARQRPAIESGRLASTVRSDGSGVSQAVR